MGKFIIVNNITRNFCDVLLVLSSSICPISPLKEIEDTMPPYSNCKIIIDQILHIGNNSERFIYLEINHGEVSKSSIKFIQIPKNDKIRELSRDVMISYDLIDFSILTTIQKNMLNKGIAI